MEHQTNKNGKSPTTVFSFTLDVSETMEGENQ